MLFHGTTVFIVQSWGHSLFLYQKFERQILFIGEGFFLYFWSKSNYAQVQFDDLFN